MTRVHNWSLRLAEALEAAEKRSFAYGGGPDAHDCALFAADCVQAITGTDYAAELRGYTSKFDAYRIVATYGSIEAMITALLGKEPIHPAFAGRGDVIVGIPKLVEGEDGECIGICTGTHVAYPKDAGLALLPRTTAINVWRVE